MATYASKLSEFSRTPVWYVKITLDLCAESFGVAPCVAIGTGNKKCYNTYPTCKDTANYNRTTKVYKFCTNGELPFNEGERPYIKTVMPLATEIKDTLPVQGRVKVIMYDEPDSDVGIDPYVSDRTSVQGTFFTKLLARNPNYKGRSIEVYEGFIGIDESEYQLRFSGKLDNISRSGDNTVTIEGVDYIGDLKRVTIPPAYSIQLTNDVGTTVTAMSFKGDDVQQLSGASTGKTLYIRINDEILSYASSNYSTQTNIISSLTRGYGRTTIDNHQANDEIRWVANYQGNAFDVMLALLKNSATADSPGAGLSTANIDEAAFIEWRDWFGVSTETVFDALIDEEVTVDEAYQDLVTLMNCRTWVGEDVKITIRRRVPNNPARTYKKLNDTANIILNSDKYNDNQGSRFTRNYLLWEYNLGSDFSKLYNFARRNVNIDLTLESSNFYGESVLNIDKTRFFRAGVMSEDNQDRFARNRQSRQLSLHRDGLPLIDVSLEMKDADIKTGDYVKVGSDIFVDNSGNQLTSAVCQVVKRSVMNNRVNLTLEKQRDVRTAFISGATSTGFSSAYTAATEAERNYGFISAAETASSTAATMSDSTPAYLIF